MSNSSSPAQRALLIALGALLLLLGAVLGWAWRAQQDKAAIEKIVRDYILANPEILPKAMENLARKETGQQLSGVRAEVEKPFAGAILGNPDGKVTLVEFTDYACGYCRQSVADVKALIAQHPDLRVVIRELPILAPESEEAARWALAAAEQGKYAVFHDAMFASGRPDAEAIRAAATLADLDIARAKAAAASPKITAELKQNYALAQQLRFNGTPSWIIGDQVVSGAVGKEALAKAIDQARGG